MLTGRKLLLADDSLTIQKVVSLTFGDEAMEVTTVGGGAEAIEKLGESLPDIVLADVFMPEPNGYALCERIKTDERTRHIPVVLLVGTFEPFNEAEARRVGADEVLTKPFQSIRDLVNKVGGLLGGQPEEKTPDAAASRDDQHDAEEATRDLSPFAADARAADPAAATPATASPAPADAFADFDMDDATIQTTPAAAFDAHHAAFDARHDANDFSEINLEEQFSDRGETEEAFILSDDLSDDDDDVLAPAPETHAATAAAAGSHANTPAASPVAESAFDAHASRAAEADDALLELGDIAPARAATAEADDFILDIGDDEEDSFDSAAFTPGHDAADEADMLFAEHAQTTEVPEAFAMPGAFTQPEAAAESQSSGQPEMYASAEVANAEVETPPSLLAVDTGELELEAPQISTPPSLLFANQPSTEAHDPLSFTEQEEDDRAGDTRDARDAHAWDGEPIAASIVAHAGGVAHVAESAGESRAEELFAAGSSSAAGATVSSSAAEAAVSSSHAVSSEPGQAAASPAASSAPAAWSPEMMDELVRRVVAHMSEKVVREIAWEVVPDLTERLVRQRLEEEEQARRQ